MTLRILSLAILSLAVAAPALAQQPQQATPEERAARFDSADKNKDGKLDKTEWLTILPEQAKASADQIWGRIDQDGDGFVTKEQFLALRQGPRPPQ